MPRIQTFICSGVCFLICSITIAQSLPKNPTIQQVVGYHQYQQKQWNYNQLPKNSVQYKSDPKYIPLVDRRIYAPKLNINPVAIPEIKKSFLVPSSSLNISSKSYLQSSQFLKYMWNQKESHGFRNKSAF